MKRAEARARWKAMPHAEMLAMAQTAPKWLGPWGRSMYPIIQDYVGEIPAWQRAGSSTYVFLNDEYEGCVQGRNIGTFKTLFLAQEACDTQLRAENYVLVGGPNVG